MDRDLTSVTGERARARIAAHITGKPGPARLGTIELQPHQLDAARRIDAAMREFGGALLADETGLGKTYVALRVASACTAPLVVAPAGLRDMWRQASGASGVG